MLTLIKNKNSAEFFTSERCHIVELLNDDNSPDLSVARCRVEPGVTTQLHSLTGTTEVYGIEQGQGIMDDGKHPGIAVAAGDNILIPADHPQRICNTGTDDLIFVVTCQPRFEPACYNDLETGE